MYFPHLDEPLLGHRARRRRRRAWMASMALLAMMYLLYRAFVVPDDEETERSEAIASADSESLQPMPGAEIRLPVGLDEFLIEEDEERSASTPTFVSGTVETGQTIFRALRDKGVPASTIQPVINAVGEVFDFRRSRVGDRFDATLDEDGVIVRFRYQVSAERAFEARLVAPGEYEALRTEIPLDRRIYTLGGTLEGSLYASVAANGEDNDLARQIVSVLQWDVDFSRDVRPGDAYRVVYEKVYLEGEFLRNGRVLAVEYRGRRVQQQAYYFNEEGLEGYYTPTGESLRRMFLKAPCSYRRISSLFDLNRLHPVLNEVRPHLGVDYAAPTGTPVVAVADGTITFRGNRGAAGNLVTIRHDNGYETAYAHLNAFKARQRVGQSVSQGDVIGFVGNTGRSTGAHLHFGMKHNGTYVDPLANVEERLPGLTGRELDEFKRTRDQLRAELESVFIPDVEMDRAPIETTSDEPRASDGYEITEF